LCFPVAIRWHDDSSRMAHVIGLIDCVGYLEPIECFTCMRIEEMNSLREVIAALFHRKFYHGESRTCKWWCRPKRVPIRERRHRAWYYLRSNSNLYEISLFRKAHCIYEKWTDKLFRCWGLYSYGMYMDISYLR